MEWFQSLAQELSHALGTAKKLKKKINILPTLDHELQESQGPGCLVPAVCPASAILLDKSWVLNKNLVRAWN